MDRSRKTLNTPKTKKNSPKSHKTGVWQEIVDLACQELLDKETLRFGEGNSSLKPMQTNC